jgi:hypothetical protein
MTLRADIGAGLRLVTGLPWLVRHPIGRDEARATIRRRLATRHAAFTALIRRIDADADNPYRALLRVAGCEPGDLDKMAAGDGVEATLEALFRAGVYLTVDEFKGRRPVVRGTTSVLVEPSSLRNSAAAGAVRALTAGSRSSRTPVTIDLGAIRDWGVNVHWELAARGAPPWTVARWSVPGGEAVAGILSIQAGSGAPLARWFTPIDPASMDIHPRYRWNIRLLRWGSRLGGVSVPRPEYVPLDDPGPIVDWLVATLRAGGQPFLVMYVSSAVRLARAALAAGVDLSGTHILGTGEPVTASRRATIRRAGIEIAARYASMEIGVLGSGCLAGRAPDDVHVFDDSVALIQAPATAAASGAARPLYVSALLPSASFTMLNVSLGDQAVITRRPCECLLGTVGWQTHLEGIRSFEKLTAGGMSFQDVDIIRVLEEVLPERFGGAPTDYQLVEEEDVDGRPRLRLLVHPEVGPIDSREVEATFLQAIGAGSGPERVMGLAWRGADLLRVERRAPLSTGSGKILHLHVGRSRVTA